MRVETNCSSRFIVVELSLWCVSSNTYWGGGFEWLITHRGGPALARHPSRRHGVGGVASLRKDIGTVLRVLPEMLPKPPTTKMSIGKRFQQSVDKYPDRDFLRFEGSSITYREANARANRLADFLTREGVGKGDVVAVLSKNHPDVVIAMLGIVKIGAICGMINFHQRGAVLEHSSV